jgi:hypothetical protein
MDGSIGAPGRFGDSYKRDKAIRKKRSGQRASKVECMKSSMKRKLRLRAYFEKCSAYPAYGLLHFGSAVHLGWLLQRQDTGVGIEGKNDKQDCQKDRNPCHA